MNKSAAGHGLFDLPVTFKADNNRSRFFMYVPAGSTVNYLEGDRVPNAVGDGAVVFPEYKAYEPEVIPTSKITLTGTGQVVVVSNALRIEE
jgi:hypothetical protein